MIDNRSSGYFVNILEYVSKGRIEFVGGDIRDYKSVASSMDGVDVVFHLAASVGRQRSIDNPQLDSEINMIGTINVLEAMRQMCIRDRYIMFAMKNTVNLEKH